MGIFRWLTDKVTRNESEDEILIICLKQAIKEIKRARIYDVSNAQADEPIWDERYFERHLDKSIGWLEKTKENAILILDKLEKKKIPKNYRGKHSLTDKELILFEFLPKLVSEIKSIIKLSKKMILESKKTSFSHEGIYHNKDTAIMELKKLLEELKVIRKS